MTSSRHYRHRVRAATIDYRRTSTGELLPTFVAPTEERIAQGNLQSRVMQDDYGRRVTVRRSLSLPEQLAQAGEFGDDVARLLGAAEWFCCCGIEAQLRGRLVRSQLMIAANDILPSKQVAARVSLARVYDAIGGDAFNCLLDTLLWEIPPRGPERKALLRAALYSLARVLKA